MIPEHARPKLAAKARLRFDRHSGRHMLLYPERGMSLNASATRIVQLCDGERSLEQIIDVLHADTREVARGRVAADVRQFLEALEERALVQWL